MGDIEKRLNKSALIIGATWRTEADANAAGMGLLPLNQGVAQGKAQMLEDESYGAFENKLTVGNYLPVDFPFDHEYRWDGNENKLLAALFGTSPAPTKQGETAAYLHSLSLADSVFGKFFTYATEKGAKVIVVPSLKVMKGSFSYANGFVKASFGVRGSHVINDSAIITSLDSVTTPANQHLRALQSQAVFRMNAQGGADFGAGDVVEPKAFTLDIERKFDGEHVSGNRIIIESRENDKPSIKLGMEFPRMDTVNDAYFADWLAGTEKKADITITGPIIAGAYAYYLKFQFPRLIVEDVEYADSKIIPAKIMLRAVVADTAPTGMTGLTLPVYAELMNTRATSLLV
jgi:hypothetical protein